jgi:hypothetical protein
LQRLLLLTRVPVQSLADSLFLSPERFREMLRVAGITDDFDADRMRPVVSIADIAGASEYLQKVAACLCKRMPQWECTECGKEVWFKMHGLTKEVRRARRDAHYCSEACRQKAYRKRKRKRVTAKASDTKVKPSRVTAIPLRKAA